ncbi:esterase [Acinetobacter sp. NCu2D-2]|uniref:RBBP9/YdeN family alpha/beta hydrolase n=1 Tax=Acinetobacter sp. NCu2D-2 TaxID=1608473 RepID=UPI0007CDDA8A|nr:alpha/beta hydrolase [Acinetobacter sp. NCu2D-2]ANF82138.1 esterase [Acinetobacter sp. NCu2D-2]
MTHTLIVPGVGGSEYEHWQSWLQRGLMQCSRVEQKDWNHPVLATWVKEFVQHVVTIKGDIEIVAHSFGCLTSVAALFQHPELTRKIKKLILVAPANPERFGENGFARESQSNYGAYFHQLNIKVPTVMLISENDPWLSFDDAQALAKSWHLKPINLGQVGHVNVASGFGPFPEIKQYLSPESSMQHISNADDGKYFFKFAF